MSGLLRWATTHRVWAVAGILGAWVTLAMNETAHAEDLYWIAQTPGTWSNVANWGTTPDGAPAGRAPTGGDAVVFNWGGSGDCVVDESVFNLTKVAIESGYTGIVTLGAGHRLTVDQMVIEKTFRMGADSQLVLTGDGTPLSGAGALDTTTSTPNTVLYTGEGQVQVAAAPLAQFYHHLTVSPSAPGLSVSEVFLGRSNENDFDAVAIDHRHGYLYAGTAISGGPEKIVKVRLADFQRVGALTLNAGEDSLSASFVDEAGDYLYVAARTNPGKIIKIRLSDLTRVGTLTLPAGENHPLSMVYEPARHMAYVGLRSSPAMIVRIRLSDFTRVDALTLPSGENEALCAAIDPVAGYAFFGLRTSPGRLVRLRLSDFTVDGRLDLDAGEDAPHSALVDPSRGKLWFGTNTAPGRVVAVDLPSFTREGALLLEPGEDFLQSAVYDPLRQMGYFGSVNEVGRLTKVDLRAAPIRVDSIALGGREYQLFLSAAIDPAAGMAYFLTDNWIGTIVKVNLHHPLAAYRHAAPLQVRGDLTIGPGTLDSDGHDITLWGHWKNTGTYHPGANTLRLMGSNQRLEGTGAFHNVVKSSGGDAALFGEALRRQVVNGTLDLQGVAGQPLQVHSTVPGTPWCVDTASLQTLRFAALSDTDAAGGQPLTALDSLDGGGNRNIVFSAPSQVAVTTAAASATSPAWVEGTNSADVTVRDFRVNDGTPTPMTAQSPTRWYADAGEPDQAPGIPLEVNQATRVTVEVANAFGTMMSATQELTWTATDLKGKDASTDRLFIRQGESLLLTATGTGNVLQLDTNGDGVFEPAGAPGQTVPAEFPASGEVVVAARIDGVSVGSLKVAAIGVDFRGPIVDQVQCTRRKDVGIAPAAHRQQVAFVPADPQSLQASVRNLITDGARLHLTALQRGTVVLQARLGSAGGPLLSQQEIDAFVVELPERAGGLHMDPETQSTTTPLTLRPHVPNVTYTLTMFASASTFAGGATTFSANSNDFTQRTDSQTGETISTLQIPIEAPLTTEAACFNAEGKQGNERCALDGAINPGAWWCTQPADVLPLNITVLSVNGRPLAPGAALCRYSDADVQIQYLAFPGKETWYENGAPAAQRDVPNLGPLFSWNVLTGNAKLNGPTDQQTVKVFLGTLGTVGLRSTLTAKPEQRWPWTPPRMLDKAFVVDLCGLIIDPLPPPPGKASLVRFPLIPFGGLSAKYRGVDIHGVPKPEPSPTGEGESDRIPNQAYVDMYNLAPSYSVTDVAIPVEGGELVLEFRRTSGIRSQRGNTNPDQQNRNIVYPAENILGLGWDANMGSRVTIASSVNGILGQQTATVVDEVGNVFFFQKALSGAWKPKITNAFSGEAVHNRLLDASDGLILQRPHGTILRYAFQRTFLSQNGQTMESYYRLQTIEDRNGNALQYVYPNSPDLFRNLLPDEIYEANHPERRLRFTYINIGIEPVSGDRGWRLASVQDPLNRETRYTYVPRTGTLQDGLLHIIEQPAVENPADPSGPLVRPRVMMTYHVEDLQEQRLDNILDEPDQTPWRYRYVAPETITDPRGHVTRFEYVQELFPVQISLSNGGESHVLFEPKLRLSSITTVDGTMTVATRSPRQPTLVETEATDTRGVRTTYRFESELKALNDNEGGVQVAKKVSPANPSLVLGTYNVALNFAKKLTRTTHPAGFAGGITQDRVAVFEWAPDSNLNLIRATDLSGNVIAWEYDSTKIPGDTSDPYNQPINGGVHDDIKNPRFYQSFNQPARRIVDPDGLRLVTEYRYETRFNKLIRQIDAEGKVTEHALDVFGNRTTLTEGKTLAPPGTIPTGMPGVFTIVNGSLLRTTSFTYQTKPSSLSASSQRAWGFVTKIVDPDGRTTVFDKRFDPLSPPAYVTQTATQTGIPSKNLPLNIQRKTVEDLKGRVRASVQPRGLVAGAVEAAFTTFTTYDDLDRPVTMSRPAVEDPADPAQLITRPIETHYDLNSNPISTKDEHGRITHRYYDLMNRMTFTRRCMTDDTRRFERLDSPGVLDPAAAPLEDLISQRSYDGAGLLVAETEPNGIRGSGPERFTTTLAYDELLRLVKKTLPAVRLPDATTASYDERYEYGANAGSGAFTLLSGWSPTRVVNRRGFAADTVYDAIYRATQTVRRLDDGSGLSPAAPPRAGEPATLTHYNRVHRPVDTTVLNERADGTPANQTTRTYYDDLHRSTVIARDLDGDGFFGPSGARGAFINSAPGFNGDAGDLITRMRYDKAGNVRYVHDPLNRITEHVYDGAGRILETRLPLVDLYDPLPYNSGGTPVRAGNSARLTPKTITTYDADSNPEIVEGPNHTRIKTFFDARNRAVKTVTDLNGDGVYDPLFNGPDLVTEMHYDLLGNAVRAVDSRGNATTMTYDRAYRVIEVAGPGVADAENGNALRQPVTTTAYDANGNVIAVTDPRGVQTTTAYDGLNRVRRVTAAATRIIGGVAQPTEVAVTMETQYDANNNMVAFVFHNRADGNGLLPPDDVQVTRYAFDPLDRQILQTLPSVEDGLVRATATTYDRNGNLRTMTDPKRQVRESEYDRANRVMATRFKQANGLIEETRTFTYSKTNALLTAVDKSGKTTYTYDTHHRPITEARTMPGQTGYTVNSFYDAAGNRTKVIYPQTGGATRTLINRYDRVNRLTRIDDGAKQTQYAYDANGNRLSCALPNAVLERFEYDALNRVTRHLTADGSAYSASYAYDVMGNKRQISEAVQGQAVRLLSYQYDDQYRLTEESWAGGANRSTYRYDLAGNRVQQAQHTNGLLSSISSRYDSLNRLLTATKDGLTTTYGYDLNGNRLSKSIDGGATTAYVFDTSDRLLVTSVNAATVFSATYDYRTRRQTTTEAGATTFFRYDGGEAFQEVTGGTTPGLQVEWIRGSGLGGGIGSILYAVRPTAEEYFTYNPVGHTVVLTGASGLVTNTNLYEAFGAIVSSTGSSPNNRLANTKERHPSIGLDNHGFRYYDPETGRYLTPDPAGYLDGLNWYLHVGNNPINRIDPLGLGWFSDFVDSVVEVADNALDAAASFSGAMADRLTGGATSQASQAISRAAGLGDVAYRENETAKIIGDATGLVVDKASSVLTPAGLLKEGGKVLAKEGLREGVKLLGTQCAKELVKDYAKDQVAVEVIDAGSQLAAETGVISEEDARAIAGTARTAINLAGSLRNQDALKKTCFMAGTPVATPAGLRPIESLRIGERVWSAPPAQQDSSTRVDPPSWRRIRLRMPNPEWGDDAFEIELLRSADELRTLGYAVGAEVAFGLAEVGVAGRATVTAIEPCPTIPPGPGRVVTMTVRHLNAGVVQLAVEGSPQLVYTTVYHKFRSAARQAFVSASLLQPDELLTTQDPAPVKLLSLEPHPGAHHVYNIEVETDHTYYVGDQKLLVHNEDCGGLEKSQDLEQLKQLQDEGLRVHSIKSRKAGETGGQGREGRVEQLEVYEFDLDQPKHVRGWLKNERRMVENGQRDLPRTPPGYEQGHGPNTPAAEGFGYLGNSKLTNPDLNDLRENR